MTLSERIEQEYLLAYKNHEMEKVGVIRLLKSAMKNRLVELKRPGGELTDAEMLEVIMKQAKQRKDSIEQYTAANRGDLAEKEAGELKILEGWLPEFLSEEELNEEIEKIISETGVTDLSGMGQVMKLLTGRFTGRIDGKQASAMVRSLLAKK